VWERVEGERSFALRRGYNAGERETKTAQQANEIGEERPVADGGPYKAGSGEEVIHFSRVARKRGVCRPSGA
jgi:hypothetical protein